MLNLNNWKLKTDELIGRVATRPPKERKRKGMTRQYMLRAEMEYRKRYSYIQRPGAADLLQWMGAQGFFEAPASMKHHGAEPGGLAQHSINVFKRLVFIAAEAIEPPKIFDIETLAIVALLHDLCKIDAYREAPEGEAKRYEITRHFPAGHGEKSVILIMRFMKLTDEEILAIRWHMGQYDFYAKGGGYDLDNAFHQCKLAVMLHLADMMATYFDEREDSSENGKQMQNMREDVQTNKPGNLSDILQ